MSISKKDLNILLVAIGILAVVGVYLLVFKPCMEKADTLEAENADLQMRVSELSMMNARKEDFQRDTARMNEKITEIFDQFPAGISPEDAVAENIAMEAVSGVLNTEIKFDEPVSFYTPLAVATEDIQKDAFADVSSVSDDGADDEEAEEPSQPASALSAMALPVKYFFTGDLEGVEKACNFINSQNNRDVISGLALTYDDSTGTLKAELLIVKNYITGTNRPYVPATFPSVVTGTADPFATRDFQYIPTEDGGVISVDGNEMQLEQSEEAVQRKR